MEAGTAFSLVGGQYLFRRRVLESALIPRIGNTILPVGAMNYKIRCKVLHDVAFIALAGLVFLCSLELRSLHTLVRIIVLCSV